MKFCPYCGADIINGSVSFCSECGKSLVFDAKEEPSKHEKKKKHEKKSNKKPEAEVEAPDDEPELEDEPEPDSDFGYDGYYDDILPGAAAISITAMSPITPYSAVISFPNGFLTFA